MAFPKKSRFRRIVIDDVIYRWQLYAGEMRGSIVIYGPESSGAPLKIRSADWFDVWLSWPFQNPKEPILVSPVLVRELILLGLQNGWNPEIRGKAKVFDWSAGQLKELEIK